MVLLLHLINPVQDPVKDLEIVMTMLVAGVRTLVTAVVIVMFVLMMTTGAILQLIALTIIGKDRGLDG